ncbi:site-specific integrase [Mycolicibacterium sp. PAM1]|uniref:tyrosine-type recombinase/integrase n=1 Tax=Mycolicibacterium sp. PAM1 TaxID=2853535 RepID=UPI001C3DA10E|nr:site-specific integrase [Mycolicibacterium sp. PAM1]MBV5246929.1 site-specific integrase [Mycolicibacterium sp. PAM1]
MIEGREGPGGSRVYRARVYYRGRYVASRTFPRKRDAQEWERKQVDALKTGVWADPKAGEKPVREWCEIWFAAQPPRQPATERKIRGVINKQISRAFGRQPLVSVRPSEVEVWAAGISRQQSPATARHALGVLRRVFDYALRDGAIHRNPAVGIKLPKVQGNDPRPLTHAQLWALVDHLPSQRDRLIVLVGGYCGLRWGELAALQWSDVDFVSHRLRVRRAYSEEAPRGEMAPVKDHQARTVPIPATVSDMLASFGVDRRPGDLVFPSASGTPLRNRNFRRDVFDDAVNSAQLDITPHNLRDTAASLAIQAGASVVAVARLLGHESAATTLNHYAGLFPSDLDDVAQRLDAAARRVQHEDNQADDMPMDQKRRWIPADEVAEILNSTPVDDGLYADIYGTAESGDSDESSDETEDLRSSPENAGRLTDAVARDKACQSAPTDASGAPTKHRPEGSDKQ